ncbi:ankyrin repeat domain-containing protein [Geovibrio thiophilus]|uniref:ankyrin repeat domain-containing protein n=1 Tax=Geovibrio thiophilus TaxID=139438 RepID=UPI0013E2986F|nr:ankyrin repeat domain-containing protein [Geovibrio thiophilus]
MSAKSSPQSSLQAVQPVPLFTEPVAFTENGVICEIPPSTASVLAEMGVEPAGLDKVKWEMFLHDLGADAVADIDRALDGNTLHMLIRTGQAKNIRAYLNAAYPDIDAADSRGFTPAAYAALYNDSEILKILEESGADVHRKFALEDGRTVDLLNLALRNPDNSLVKFMSFIGNDPAEYLLEQGFSFENGEEYLLDSLQSWRYPKEILKTTNLNAVAHTGNPLFSEALKAGADKDVIRHFLENGVKITAKADLPVLNAAAGNRGIRAADIEKIISMGGNVNGRTAGTRETPLMAAVKNGREDLAEALLAKGADPMLKDAEGETAFDYMSGNADKTERLKKLMNAYRK